jgi:hypothetical protein
MNHPFKMHEADTLNQAMAAFLQNAVAAKHKHAKIKTNMACRRKLEIKREQQRLARETSEYEFN